MVLLFHFGLLDMGWMGVEIFFVLSGYLITSILSDGKKWPLGFYLKRFYWRRVLRIFPAYFALIGIFALLYVITGHPGNTAESLPYLLTYTLNIYIFSQESPLLRLFDYLWSLSFEEQFYVFWPLLVYVFNRRGFVVLCLGIVLLSPVIRYLLADYLVAQRGTHEFVGGKIYYFPLGQLDTFATGALLAAMPWKEYVKRPLRFFGTFFSLFLAAGAINMVLFYPDSTLFVISNFGYPVSSLVHGQHIWTYSLINLTAASLILVAIFPDSKAGGYLRKALESKPLVQLGKVSYGLYLLHWPMQIIFERFVELENNIVLRFLQFLPFFALASGAAWLSFRYYESWFLRKKKDKFNQIPASKSKSST
jgi:peptidoglycan/LPS O-acetylase OafA/YrhL